MKQQIQTNKIEWEEVEIGELLDYEQPGKYIVEGEILKEKTKNSIPVLTANKSFILGYTEEKEGIYNKSPVILFDDFTTDTKFVDFKFKVKSSAMKLLRPKSKDINLKFVFLMMKGIQLNFSTHKRYYLSVYQIRKILMPFKNGKPDLKEQERMVKILEESEKLTQRGKKAGELLDEFLKSVFYEMFYNKGFKIKKLEETSKIIMGQSPPGNSYNEKGNGTPFFQGKAEFTNKYPIIKKWTDKPTKLAEPNSILMSVRAPVGDVNLCNVKCCIGRGLASIKPIKEITNLYFIYFLLQNIKNKIAYLGSGSTFKAINSNQVRSLKIPLPPLTLQQKFARIVEQTEKMKDQINKTKQNSKELFNSLVSKAFKGKL